MAGGARGGYSLVVPAIAAQRAADNSYQAGGAGGEDPKKPGGGKLGLGGHYAPAAQRVAQSAVQQAPGAVPALVPVPAPAGRGRPRPAPLLVLGGQLPAGRGRGAHLPALRLPETGSRTLVFNHPGQEGVTGHGGEVDSCGQSVLLPNISPILAPLYAPHPEAQHLPGVPLALFAQLLAGGVPARGQEHLPDTQWPDAPPNRFGNLFDPSASVSGEASAVTSSAADPLQHVIDDLGDLMAEDEERMSQGSDASQVQGPFRLAPSGETTPTGPSIRRPARTPLASPTTKLPLWKRPKGG